MARLTVQPWGEALNYQPADAAGDEIINDGNTQVLLFNGTGSPLVVRFHAVTPCNQGVIHDYVVTVTAAWQSPVALFHPRQFNTPERLLQWTYETAPLLGVTVTAQRFPNA